MIRQQGMRHAACAWAMTYGDATNPTHLVHVRQYRPCIPLRASAFIVGGVTREEVGAEKLGEGGVAEQAECLASNCRLLKLLKIVGTPFSLAKAHRLQGLSDRHASIQEGCSYHDRVCLLQCAAS